MPEDLFGFDQEEAKQPPEPEAPEPAVEPSAAPAEPSDAPAAVPKREARRQKERQPPKPEAAEPAAEPAEPSAAPAEPEQETRQGQAAPELPKATAASQGQARPEPAEHVPPEPEAPYFWQQQAWDRLRPRLDKLPHALLLHAPEGYAMEEFAQLLCRSILVTGADRERQAVLFDSGNHPELTVIKPDGKTIGIDDVRDGISWLGLRSMDPGQRRLLALHEADRMSRGAANALLKCLEEAPGNGLILLLSYKPHSLPATISSRCVKVPLFHAETGQVREWLHSRLPPEQHTAANMLLLAGYGPTTALQHLDQKGNETKTMVFRFFIGKTASQPVPELAKSWQAAGTGRALLWMRAMLFAAIREQLGDASIGAGLAGRLAVSDLRQLLDFYGQVTQHERLYHGQGGISDVALLEALMLRWLGLGNR